MVSFPLVLSFQGASLQYLLLRLAAKSSVFWICAQNGPMCRIAKPVSLKSSIWTITAEELTKNTHTSH